MSSVNYIKSKNKRHRQGIIYDAQYGGYVKNSCLEPLRYLLVSREDAHKIQAGHRKEFFPEYDPETHSLGIDIPYQYESERCQVILYNTKVKEPETLPYGSYTVKIKGGVVVLVPLTINMDKYIDFNQNIGAKYYEEFTRFRKAREIYKEEGEIHKKGNFTFGPPGCGKTMEISKLLSRAADEKFYGFTMTSKTSLDLLFEFRDILKEEDCVIILEEITERLEIHTPEELLSFTDGEMSWEHCYIIATTNYPEKLAPNIVDRPRRFSTICEVTFPDREQKAKFMRHKGVSEKDIEIILNLIDDKISIDYVREILLIAKLEQKSYNEVISTIKENRRLISKSFRGTIGLHNNSGKNGQKPNECVGIRLN